MEPPSAFPALSLLDWVYDARGGLDAKWVAQTSAFEVCGFLFKGKRVRHEKRFGNELQSIETAPLGDGVYGWDNGTHWF
jgi:hypothetical protein